MLFVPYRRLLRFGTPQLLAMITSPRHEKPTFGSRCHPSQKNTFMTALIVRAQTLALHAEATADDGAAIELRVQVMCDGAPAVDATGVDGSGWALLSQEQTLKFTYGQARAGCFDFGQDAGRLELRVLSRKQGSDDAAAVQLVGIASLDPPAQLRAKGSSWNDLAVLPPTTGATGASRTRAIGALIVKASVPPAKAAAAAAPPAPAAPAAPAVPAPPQPSTQPAAAPPMPIPPQPTASKVSTQVATQRVPSSIQPHAPRDDSGGSLSASELARLVREVEAEERLAAAALAEAERVEGQLEASRSQTTQLRQELEHAKDSLKGRRKADFKAQKLHVLERQARQLSLQLETTHRAIARAMDESEHEERRLAQLIGSAA